MDTKAILQENWHRPFPLPKGPWIMVQGWKDLLFAHWPIEPSVLRPLIPCMLTLETYEQQCWIGIVPFLMTNVHPRGIPSVPWLSQFPELNVRTYVSVNGIPGVYFFSLDAGNPVAVDLARTFFHLPYFNANMNIKRAGDMIIYNSQRTHRHASEADYVVCYRPCAPVSMAEPGSLAYWLTERYCLYAVTERSQVYRGNIHHRRWPLQIAELETSTNTMTRPHNITLPDVQPLLHYASLQEVLIWWPERVV